jgi:hypothetical protein
VPAPFLERVSKAGAAASALAVAAFLIALHPDMTGPLQAGAAAALAAGWAAGARRAWLRPAWVLLAPLAPAVLRQIAGREGPVLDFVWMAGLTASLARTTSWSRWTLPDLWRVPAGGWALTLTLAWPVLLAREIGWDLALVRDFGAVHSAGLLSAPDVAGWTLFVVWTHLLGLLWLDSMAAAFARAREVPGTVHGLWAGATLAAIVGLYQAVFDLGFASTSFWASLGRTTGTLLDANAFGMTAALAGPVAYLALNRRASSPAWAVALGPWTWWTVLLLNLAGVWTSGSRTAALAAALGTASLFVALGKSLGDRARRRVLVAGAAAVPVALAIGLASGAAGPLRRLFDRPNTTESLLAAVFNRGPYGTTALHMVRDHPLTGVGAGSYEVLSADYWRLIAGEALPPDDAQNWWRHQAAEFGLLGGLPLAVWSALLAWAVLARAPDPLPQPEWTATRGLVAAVGVCSLLQVPTQVPVVLLWFLSIVAWMASLRASTASAAINRTWSGGWWTVAAALAAAYAVGHLVLARGPLDPAARAAHARREYVVGAFRPEPLPVTGEFRWTGQRSRFRWPARTRWLVLRLWAEHPDLERDPVRVTVSSPCAVLFDRQVGGYDPVRLALVAPAGTDTFDVTVEVSRTWRPSDTIGGGDTRRLGVGVAADFADGAADLGAAQRIEAPSCARPGA